MVDCIRNTLDRRVQFYEEENRRLSEQRFTPIWNFCNFFILKVSNATISNAYQFLLIISFSVALCFFLPLCLCAFLELTLLFVQESLAFMFDVTNLYEDSLREYDELELCYSESGFSSTLFWGSYVALTFELH